MMVGKKSADVYDKNNLSISLTMGSFESELMFIVYHEGGVTQSYHHAKIKHVLRKISILGLDLVCLGGLFEHDSFFVWLFAAFVAWLIDWTIE